MERVFFEPVALALASSSFARAASQQTAGTQISSEAHRVIQNVIDRLAIAESSPNKIEEINAIILCGDRNRIEVEYSLKGIDKPVGVAEYTLTRELPAELVDKLPKPEDLEKQILQELGNGENDTMK